jgi:hypothetical protein
MTQYQPSPYSMPYQPAPPIGYTYDPYGQYLGPARRAGLLMIILGSLVAVYAVCNGTIMFALPADQLMRSNPMMTREAAQFSPDALKTIGVIVSILMLVVGIAKLVLGTFVRRNSSGAIVGGLVIAIGVTVVLGLLTLMCAIAGIAAPPVLIFACVMIVPLALVVLEMIWLVQALRAGSQIRSLQAQYQAQYHQYQQQQQAYAQQYGYAQQPPPQQQQTLPQPQQPAPGPETAAGEGGSDAASPEG